MSRKPNISFLILTITNMLSWRCYHTFSLIIKKKEEKKKSVFLWVCKSYSIGLRNILQILGKQMLHFSHLYLMSWTYMIVGWSIWIEAIINNLWPYPMLHTNVTPIIKCTTDSCLKLPHVQIDISTGQGYNLFLQLNVTSCFCMISIWMSHECSCFTKYIMIFSLF